MNCYSTVARLAKFPGLLTSIPRALAVARIEGWRKARRSAPTLWATTSQASRQTGTSPACSNSSPRPQRRALKPASQCHCTAPARDGQRKLPLTVLTACSNDVRVMQQDLFGPVLPLVATDSLDAAIAYVNGAFIEPDALDPVAAQAWRAQPKSRCQIPAHQVLRVKPHVL